ncbi:MAG: T9SS type A sorting domain-containing protein [Saprospiraceae bacterium]
MRRIIKNIILGLGLLVTLWNKAYSQDTVRLSLIPTLNGDTVRLQLLARQFTGVDKFSVSFNYSHTDLQFSNVNLHPNLTVLNEVKDSVFLNFSWTNPNAFPLSLPDNSVLAEFSFVVLRRNVQTCFDFGAPARPAAFFTPLGALIPVIAEGVCSHLFGGVITGQLRLDVNRDCMSTPDEPPAAQQIIRFKSGTGDYLAITKDDGSYSRYLPYGSYTVSAGATLLTQSCLGQQPVMLNDQNLQFDYSPAVSPKSLCPLLHVEYNSGLLEWCKSVNTSLRYFNYGTEQADNVYILLSLDPSLTVEQTSVPYTLLGPSLLRFDIVSINAQTGSQINIRLKSSCNTSMQNRTVQGIARIFPSEYCSPSPLYSGAELEVTALCINNEDVFEIKNTGTADMKTALVFNTVEDDIMPNFGGKIKLDKGASEIIRFPADGKTRIIIVDTISNHPYGVHASAGLEGCGTLPNGSVSKGYINNFAQGDQQPSVSRYSSELHTNSIAPLQITALPEGAGNFHYINKDDRINYTFLIQNTGNNAAHRVIVRNVIPSSLDISTLQIARSEFLTDWSLVDQRTLELVFDPINLPPSAENALSSRIYFSYSIKPQTEITVNTVINNSAQVLMDNGIISNSDVVRHTIGSFIFTIGSDPDSEQDDVKVYPNPSAGSVHFECTVEDAYWLYLYDLQGALLEIRAFTGKSVNTDALAAAMEGMYAYTICTKEKRIASGKIIKENKN